MPASPDRLDNGNNIDLKSKPENSTLSILAEEVWAQPSPNSLSAFPGPSSTVCRSVPFAPDSFGWPERVYFDFPVGMLKKTAGSPSLAARSHLKYPFLSN